MILEASAMSLEVSIFNNKYRDDIIWRVNQECHFFDPDAVTWTGGDHGHLI